MRGRRTLEFRKPDYETLYDLYVTQRLTTRQIAAQYGVVKTSVINWLNVYDIPRRDGHNGLINRGVTPPTREELVELVHVKHLPYAEIGKMYGVDNSAITYWLRKHNIPCPKIWDTRYKGNRPILPTEEVLRDLYEVQGLSQTEIGLRYNVGPFPIGRLCKKYGIPIKPDGWTGQRYICKDGHAVKSVYEQRIDDWLYEHAIEHEYEPQLPFDHRYHADFLANGYYIEMWGVRKNATYTQRRKYKTQLYKQHNLPLIEITESRMTSHAWQKHLQKYLHTEHTA